MFELQLSVGSRKIKFIFVKYLYSPRHEPIDMNMLYSDLEYLGKLINNKLNGKKKSRTISQKNFHLDKAEGLHKKTIKKNTKNKYNKSFVSFKRKPKQKRFKNPFFLSLK